MRVNARVRACAFILIGFSRGRGWDTRRGREKVREIGSKIRYARILYNVEINFVAGKNFHATVRIPLIEFFMPTCDSWMDFIKDHPQITSRLKAGRRYGFFVALRYHGERGEG